MRCHHVVPDRVMQLEALQQAGADRHERTATRTAHRNGTRDRSFVTRYGDITLSKQHLRKKPFKNMVFGHYTRVKKVLANAIADSDHQGIPASKVAASILSSTISPLHRSPVSRRILMQSELRRGAIRSIFEWISIKGIVAN